MSMRRRRSPNSTLLRAFLVGFASFFSIRWTLLFSFPRTTTSFTPISTTTTGRAANYWVSSPSRPLCPSPARIRREEQDFYDDDDYFDEDYDGAPFSRANRNDRKPDSSVDFVEWQNTVNNPRQSSAKPFTNERSPPSSSRPSLVDPWMADRSSDDKEEEYGNSLRIKRQQPSAAPSRGRNANRDPYYHDDGYDDTEDADAYPPAMNNYADDEDSDVGYYDDSEQEFGYDNLKEPGNFWSNPVQRPDPGPSTATSSKFSTSREIRRPRPTADPDLQPQQRRRSGTRTTTTFRSGTPPPPKPFADLYHRLFWYGLETDDDLSSSSQEESRTMFGGTKGKFNGLSYLYNGEAVVPPGQRRPLPPRNERRQQERRAFSPSSRGDRRDGNLEEYYEEEEEEEDYAYFDDGADDNNRRDEYASQRMPRRRNDLVTPPTDPPRPVWDRRSNGRQKRSAVASWWENDADDGDDYDSNFGSPYDRSGQRPPTRRRPRSSKNDWTSALDTFLGLDRERLQDQAAVYDRRIRSNGSSSSNYRRARSWKHPDDSNEDDENIGTSPPSFVRDEQPGQLRSSSQPAVPSPAADTDIIDAEHVVEKHEPSTATSPSPSSLLTWEERALAVERVPPANVPAWGPAGDLRMDARTKALQDALQDIASAKQVVEERRQRVAMAQDQLAVLRVDAQLERKRLMKHKRSHHDDFDAERTAIAAREALRRTQRRIGEASRRLRWRQLQWDEAVQELAQVEARHWALLKAYSPEKARQVVEEAWQELTKTEPAVARYSEKLKSQQQQEQQDESESSYSENSASESF